MEEDIVVNVEFEGENLPIPNVGNVQVVPANIAWEDFELMVGKPVNSGVVNTDLICMFKYSYSETNNVLINRIDSILRVAFLGEGNPWISDIFRFIL